MGSEDLFEYWVKDFENEPEEVRIDCDWNERPLKGDDGYPQQVTLPIGNPQLVVSEVNFCDSNASTIAIGDRDIRDWNNDHDGSITPHSHCADERQFPIMEITVRFVPKNLPRKNDIVNVLKIVNFALDESKNS